MDKHGLEDLPRHPYGTSDITLDYMIDILEIGEDKLIYTLEDLWSMGQFPPPLIGHRFTHLGQRDVFSWGSSIRKELIPGQGCEHTTWGLRPEYRATKRATWHSYCTYVSGAT